jgi:hypothetical protein
VALPGDRQAKPQEYAAGTVPTGALAVPPSIRFHRQLAVGRGSLVHSPDIARRLDLGAT